MGAWNYGVFDDDIAYDALDNLRVIRNYYGYGKIF